MTDDPSDERVGQIRRRWCPQFGYDTQQRSSTWVRCYYEPRDKWVGYFRGPAHNYICLLPCLVIRVLNKRGRRDWRGFGFDDQWPFENMLELSDYD